MTKKRDRRINPVALFCRNPYSRLTPLRLIDHLLHEQMHAFECHVELLIELREDGRRVAVEKVEIGEIDGDAHCALFVQASADAREQFGVRESERTGAGQGCVRAVGGLKLWDLPGQRPVNRY